MALHTCAIYSSQCQLLKRTGCSPDVAFHFLSVHQLRIGSMSTAPVWQGSDVELLAELVALETRLHSTWAQMLSVVAEIDSRGMAGAAGYGTTVELVRAVARVSRGEARARVALGSGELPTEGGERPQVVVTVSLPVLQGRIGSASLAMVDRSTPTSPAALRATRRLFRWCWAPGVSRWTSDAPATPCPQRSAVQ